MRTLLAGLAILHLGPGVAFAILAVGCDGYSPLLGVLCGHNSIITFVMLTAGAWLVLLVGYVALRSRSQSL